MTKTVDLVSYLPPFMADFKEISVTLEAENPEFVLVWKAADRVLQNEFIESADEYGISRFEKILNILPSTEDTLESRRARVQARWFNTIPYTMKAFLAKLEALCSDSDFTVTKEYDKYTVRILTNLELFGQVEELEHIIDGMMPCNMIVISVNEIPCDAKGFAFVAGGVCSLSPMMNRYTGLSAAGQLSGVERYTPPIILLPMTARKILRSAVWRHTAAGR